MIHAVDLFCGAGGTSTGVKRAVEVDLRLRLDLLAINHWPTAVNSHTLNHPNVRHLCESLDNVRPVDHIPSRRVHLLCASPECTHHSVAAGGTPKNEQSRATAWHVCRWASDLTIDSILIENVKEFQHWGPLGKSLKPLKRRKGETFRAFVEALRSMNYSVEWRVQRASDFGDPQDRDRLIIMAVRGGGAIRWPEATHGPGLAHLKRTARDSVIDWSIKGKSIHGRKKPLSPNTLRRIGAGLRKFGGVNAGPFLVMLYGTNDARTLDRPVDAPLPTVTGAHRGEMAICEPFIIPVNYGERAGQSPRVHGVDAPMPTVVGSNTHALVEPFILGQQSCSAPRSTDAPLPTVSCGGAIALCEPFIVKYYGTGTAVGVDKPLDTVTTKDRFMLVEPRTGRVVAELDILFRMLQPHELAAAQSFPRDYVFTGNKSEQTKQIGNAVPVELARAHVRALLA